MLEDFGNRIRALSSGARWLIATAAILILLVISTFCSTFWMFVAVVSSDACSALPDWMGLYLALPPGMLALGSLLSPIPFALRVRLPIVIGVLVGSVALSLLLAIAWLPLVFSQC